MTAEFKKKINQLFLIEEKLKNGTIKVHKKLRKEYINNVIKNKRDQKSYLLELKYLLRIIKINNIKHLATLNSPDNFLHYSNGEPFYSNCFNYDAINATLPWPSQIIIKKTLVKDLQIDDMFDFLTFKFESFPSTYPYSHNICFVTRSMNIKCSSKEDETMSGDDYVLKISYDFNK